MLALLALVLFAYGLIHGAPEVPSFDRSPASFVDGYQVTQRENSAEAVEAQKQSTFNRFKKWLAHRNFSKFRPVQSKDEFRYVQAMPEKTMIEEIYSPAKTREMQAKYNASMGPLEQKMNNPYRMARQNEVEQFNTQNQELANWTAKEALNEKLRMLLSGADKDSAPIQVFQAVHSVSNIGGDDKPASASNKTSAGTTPNANPVVLTEAAKKEESIPTRLKAKMNLIAGRAQLLFSNPVANTTFNVDARQRPAQDNELSTADRAVVGVNKDIQILKMKSDIKYGLERKVLEFNVSQPITDTISCNLTSQKFTNDQRNAAGVKSQESVNMVYSIHF